MRRAVRASGLRRRAGRAFARFVVRFAGMSYVSLMPVKFNRRLQTVRVSWRTFARPIAQTVFIREAACTDTPARPVRRDCSSSVITYSPALTGS